MEYTYLGRTGVKVSRLCLGTMNFGPNTEEKEAFRIMDCAIDHGVNFFDTANMYGGRNGGKRGWTEEIIGRWFRLGGGRRERVILATKIFEPMDDLLDGPNDEQGLSAWKIRRHTEGCLRRLQTDHVELLYMHNPPPHAEWAEIWPAFERLTAEGKIDYAAGRNFAAYQAALAQASAKERHFMGLVANQNKYNLLSRLPEIELIPASMEMGLAFLPWSPLQGGMLSGSVLKNMQSGQRSGKYAGKLSPAQMTQLKMYHQLCLELGQDEATVSMAWLLNRPGVTAPLVGPRTQAQLMDSLKVMDWLLPQDAAEKIEAIFPGPGGSAPQVYMH
ncbi:MAG: aldo/keto reductase [Clostridia bacterium]|nr:aldo/keto reductase [Clostridia bacterium]